MTEIDKFVREVEDVCDEFSKLYESFDSDSSDDEDEVDYEKGIEEIEAKVKVLDAQLHDPRKGALKDIPPMVSGIQSELERVLLGRYDSLEEIDTEVERIRAIFDKFFDSKKDYTNMLRNLKDMKMEIEKNKADNEKKLRVAARFLQQC